MTNTSDQWRCTETMNSINKFSPILILTCLIVGYLLVSPAIASAQTATMDSEEVSELLSQANAEAHQLEFDAGHMIKYPLSELSDESHANKINEIKEHVNKCGKLLTKLQDARETGSEWQQQAIDEILPLLKQIAANTTSAIEHIKSNRGHLKVNPAGYQAYLKANFQLSKELAAMISDYIEYGKHKAEFDRLGEKLEVAGD